MPQHFSDHNRFMSYYLAPELELSRSTALRQLEQISKHSSPYFEGANEGDKVWDVVLGEGEVVRIGEEDDRPITVYFPRFGSHRFYTLDGQYERLQNQVLFWPGTEIVSGPPPTRKGDRKMKDIKCVQPSAPWVVCCVCDRPVKTCEREEPINNDYCCPVHSDGSELSDGTWVCSDRCWDIAVGDEE